MSTYSGDWIPLLDYASKTKISLSTLRRHIKAKKVPFRLEKGRYFLLDQPLDTCLEGDLGEEEALKERILFLEKTLQKAQKEIVELRTLLAFYEENTPP